ncbi:MAG TPA: type II toxin-antitoxin system RelE/ParE family toxin [Urbifossiella sp.]|jgi:plasmid stabilization system protein ParE|nr:type II toxin-antitoxin system RelE/ParE family toxin [Urbifossiella sp.]
MSFPVALDPEARTEFDDGYDLYEGRQTKLGRTFADAVESVLRGIGATPKMHAVVFGDIRRAVVRGFPYCIYYLEEPALVPVISVFHTSRDPKIWQSRV